MNDIVINIKNLSKEYRLGEISSRTLSQDIESAWYRLRGKNNPHCKNQLALNKGEDKIWALKDINLKVKKGELLGIIGHNGAGKSTLLKILSRITSPTSGLVQIKGRVTSLLEVGTGFHPELTGRENIYLNGALLGMRKKEIDSRLEQIIDFSGIEKYIETPVKRYSSGMRVRLAFSVAAHLEADILLVDEVLAVGDLDFQQKSMNYLGQDNAIKKTVLFVSHRLIHIEELTKRTILFSKGSIEIDGPTDDVIQYYKENTLKKNEINPKVLFPDNDNKFKINYIKLYDIDNNEQESFIKGEYFKIKFQMSILKISFPDLVVILIIEDANGKEITGNEVRNIKFYKGMYEFEFIEDKIRYNWGDYFISIIISSKINRLVEFNLIKRISFKNKLLNDEIRYGGYLLNQMRIKVNKLD